MKKVILAILCSLLMLQTSISFAESAGERVARESMIKAQAEKERNDRTVERQRETERKERTDKGIKESERLEKLEKKGNTG